MTMEISEVEMKDLDNDQLEQLGRLLDPPFEVDRREKRRKILGALGKHIKEGAKLTSEWPPAGFHAGDGLHFRRDAEGAVTVTKVHAATEAQDEIVITDELSADTWASVVAWVSRFKDSAEGFELAGFLHDGDLVSIKGAKDAKQVASAVDDLHELVAMTAPLPANNYQAPNERKFRENLHARLNRLADAIT